MVSISTVRDLNHKPDDWIRFAYNENVLAMPVKNIDHSMHNTRIIS